MALDVQMRTTSLSVDVSFEQDPHLTALAPSPMGSLTGIICLTALRETHSLGLGFRPSLCRGSPALPTWGGASQISSE